MNIGNKRASWINYYKPGIFMITMNKAPELPYFSRIIFNPEESEVDKQYRPNYYKLGFEIYDEFVKWKNSLKEIKINQYVIMPDHIHFILEIKKELDRHLGHYLADFKKDIFDAAVEKRIIDPDKFESVFKRGFNDQFLKYQRKLDTLYQYIRRNPYEYWERWHNPQYFRRISEETISDEKCSLYGNLSILENPFRYPVIVHRSDSKDPTLLKKKWETWEYAIANGGVLVGAFVSKLEQKVRDLAFANNAKVIYIRDIAYNERQKPYKSLFDQCKKGNLLLLSPRAIVEREDMSFRQKCKFMNRLAERMSD